MFKGVAIFYPVRGGRLRRVFKVRASAINLVVLESVLLTHARRVTNAILDVI